MIDDDKVRRSYRDLPREEPPESLDRAIIASAHRAVAPARRQWAVPVSVAAVLVLALGVTLRMQREEPGIETSMPSRVQPEQAAQAPRRDAEETRAAATASVTEKPEAPPKVVRQEKPKAKTAPLEKKDANIAAFPDEKLQTTAPVASPAPPAQPAPAAEPPAHATVQSAPAAPAAAAAPAPAMRAKSNAQGFAADAAKESQADPRLKELERIAQLRRDGRHGEADQALEKFRSENPQYKIPDALWEQVKPR